MTKMSLELSDGLKDLSRIIGDYQHEPRIFDPNDATIIRASIELLHQRARELETELSRRLWNEAAAREKRDRISTLVAEATRSGTNLRLLGNFAADPGAERGGAA